jgi:hypothetical protein
LPARDVGLALAARTGDGSGGKFEGKAHRVWFDRALQLGA